LEAASLTAGRDDRSIGATFMTAVVGGFKTLAGKRIGGALGADLV